MGRGCALPGVDEDAPSKVGVFEGACSGAGSASQAGGSFWVAFVGSCGYDGGHLVQQRLLILFFGILIGGRCSVSSPAVVGSRRVVTSIIVGTLGLVIIILGFCLECSGGGGDRDV